MTTATASQIILHLIRTDEEFANMINGCKTPQEMAIKANLAVSKMISDGKIIK